MSIEAICLFVYITIILLVLLWRIQDSKANMWDKIYEINAEMRELRQSIVPTVNLLADRIDNMKKQVDLLSVVMERVPKPYGLYVSQFIPPSSPAEAPQSVPASAD